MNRDERGIICAMIFGDGYLQVRRRKTNGKYEYVQSELRIYHSIKQIQYVRYKAELVRKILGGVFQVCIHENTGPGKRYTLCGFAKSHKSLRYMKRWFYPEGKKTFTRFTLNMLTPHGLAIWWMDDGHLYRNHRKDGTLSSVHGVLNTYCAKEEAELICEVLESRFNLNGNPGFEKAKGSYIVRFNNASCRRLQELIEPFIITEMQYKIDPIRILADTSAGHPKEGDEIVGPYGNKTVRTA